jgi:type IV pilus assembly protein PilM
MDLKQEIKLSDLLPKGLAGNLSSKQKSRGPRKRATMPGELVGLKIGSTSLTAAQVVNNGGKSLVKVARAPLAGGIVTGGEVRDPAALGAALTQFFAENELPRRGIRLGVGSTRIGVRLIELAAAENTEQLENAIGFRAHEILSVPLDETIFDYHVVGTDVAEDGTATQRILIVVAYRESVDRYLAATEAAQLEVAGIDLEAFALLRAAAEPRPESVEPEAALVALAVDHERTTLAISDGRACQFTRVLEWGGANLDGAIARVLKITAAEADELKRTLSLDDQGGAGESEAGGEESRRLAEARDAVRRECATLIRELQSSLRFYQSQPDALPVNEIHVSGGTVDMPGFVAEVGKQLGVALTIADPFKRVEHAEGVERPEHVGGFSVAVGLGIED